MSERSRPVTLGQSDESQDLMVLDLRTPRSNPWFHVPGDDPRAVSAETLAAVTSATARALEGVERFDR